MVRLVSMLQLQYAMVRKINEGSVRIEKQKSAKLVSHGIKKKKVI